MAIPGLDGGLPPLNLSTTDTGANTSGASTGGVVQYGVNSFFDPAPLGAPITSRVDNLALYAFGGAVVVGLLLALKRKGVI